MSTPPELPCQECGIREWKLVPDKGEWECSSCGVVNPDVSSNEESNLGSLYGEHSHYQKVRRGAVAGDTLRLSQRKDRKDFSGSMVDQKYVRKLKRANLWNRRTDPNIIKARKDADVKDFITNLLEKIQPNSVDNIKLVQALLKDRRVFVRWQTSRKRQTDVGARIKNDDAHLTAWTEIYIYISNPSSTVIIEIKSTHKGDLRRFKDGPNLLTLTQITKNRDAHQKRRSKEIKEEIKKEIHIILRFLQVALNSLEDFELQLFRLRHYDRKIQSNDFIPSISNHLKSDREKLILDVDFKSKITSLEDDKYNQVISALEDLKNTERFDLIIENLRINKERRIVDHLLYHIYRSKSISRRHLEKVLDRNLQAKNHNVFIDKLSSLEGFPSIQNQRT